MRVWPGIQEAVHPQRQVSRRRKKGFLQHADTSSGVADAVLSAGVLRERWV